MLIKTYVKQTVDAYYTFKWKRITSKCCLSMRPLSSYREYNSVVESPVYVVTLSSRKLCCMKGEKVSTPLDKDGIGPSGLQHIYG